MADGLIDVYGGNTADNPIVGAAVSGTCNVIDPIAGSDGSKPDTSPTVRPAGDGVLLEGPWGEVYNRIWLVPPFITRQNPAADVDIPFTLWQAYPFDNQLTTIGGSGQDGTNLDLSAPRDFFLYEELVVNLQVESDAPPEILATYIFTFESGAGTFIFQATTLDWLHLPPDFQPVTETWQWKTDVIITHDSTEQRISGRRQPRRMLEFIYLLDTDVERQREYDRLFHILAGEVLVPFYQFYTKITTDSLEGATQLYFDRDKTDVRDGEFVVIYRESTGDSFPVRLTTVNENGAVVPSLTRDVLAGDFIVPAFLSHLENRTALQMTSVSGRLPIKVEVSEFRVEFARPNSSAVIDTFDSLNILDRRPLARNPAQEVFDVNPFIIDSETGVKHRSSAWLHAQIGGARQWSISRRTDFTEMDYFRDFLTSLVGMREPFLLPTFREDQYLAEDPPAGSTQISVEGVSYARDYWPHDTFKRLRLVANDGEVIYRKADNAEEQIDDTSLVTLNEALPVDLKWGEGFEIGFLNKVRLGSDEVSLEHFGVYTILDLTVRTTDQ